MIVVDTREPDPHPWAPYWPEVTIERGTMQTGDLCLAGHPAVVVERKTPEDLVACIGRERERFERELRRACHLDRFAIVVSGTLADLARVGRIHQHSITGTLAAWARRYRHPFIFAGNDQTAADFALRFLVGLTLT